MFNDIGELLRSDGDGAAHKLGDVIALQKLTMVVGVGTGQFEGFAAAPVVVNMGDEGPCVVAVVASAAEHHPSPIARPRVVTLGVIAVDFRQWSGGRCV